MPRRISPELCARCKGYKRLCGLPYCPILARFRAQVQAVSRVGSLSDVAGATPPSIIVGEAGYPRVPVIYQIPPGVRGEEAKIYDDPLSWHSTRLPLGEIVRLRSQLLGAITRVDATLPWRLYEKELSLAAISLKPVDSEAILEKPPIPSLRFDGLLAPQGPSAPARDVKVTENPRIHPRLEKIIWDDAPSAQAVIELYKNGVDIYSIMRAFSLGLLGRLRNRRLVPTRWAITAVDQIISTNLLKRVRTFDTIDHIEVYHASYLGNYFTIILLPGGFEAELFEVWHPFTPWTEKSSKPIVYRIREYPSLKMEPLDGGYIAIRIALAEHLYTRKRQAKAIIIREITREYFAPVGNWHIRETTRRALRSSPYKSQRVADMVQHVSGLLKSRSAREALESSSILRDYEKVKKLDYFLRR